MKAAIRYYTKTGNTKKLMEAIQEVVGAEALPVSVPLDEPADVLFLGNSVYAANVDREVREFLEANRSNIGRIINVSTAALLESTYSRISKLAGELGITMDEHEFHCKGQFKFMHKGRPDENDISDVINFAKEVMMEYKNI